MGHLAPVTLRRMLAWAELIAERNATLFGEYWSGAKVYVPEHGFATEAEAEPILARQRAHERSGLVAALYGTTRDAPARYLTLFHRLPDNASGAPSLLPYLRYVQGRRDVYDTIRRRDAPLAFERRLQRGPSFNDWLYAQVDAVLRFLGLTVGKPVQDRLQRALDEFAELDLDQELEDAGDTLIDEYLVCAVPENIDGSEQYSPFCFPLVPETLASGIEAPPDQPLAPTQLPWADELIVKNCTNTFNGEDFFWGNFSLSDNCPVDDGQDRPLCPDCDHCRRDYRNCHDFGFDDFYDSILYVLSVLPRVLDVSLQGGFVAVDLEATILILTFLFTLPFYGLLTAIVLSWIQALQLWTAPFVFGTPGVVPWGWFVTVLAFMFATVLLRFPMALIAVAVYTGTWLLLEVVGAPSIEASFQPLEGLIDALEYAQSSIFISGLAVVVTVVVVLVLAALLLLLVRLGYTVFGTFFGTIVALLLLTFGILGIAVLARALHDALTPEDLPTLAQLQFRAESFLVAPGDPIPRVNTQCFFWRFDNLAILYLIGVVALFFVGPVLVRVGYAIALFFYGFVLLVLAFRVRVRRWATREDVESNEDRIDRLGQRVERVESRGERPGGRTLVPPAFPAFPGGTRTPSTATSRVGRVVSWITRRRPRGG